MYIGVLMGNRYELGNYEDIISWKEEHTRVYVSNGSSLWSLMVV